MRTRIGLQIVLAVGLVTALGIGLLATVTLRTHRQEMIAQLTRSADLLSETVKRSTEDYMLENRRDRLRPADRDDRPRPTDRARAGVQQARADRLLVRRERGRARARQAGRVLLRVPRAGPAAREAAGPRPRSHLHRRSPVTACSASSIRSRISRPARRAACHAHGPDETVLGVLDVHGLARRRRPADRREPRPVSWVWPSARRRRGWPAAVVAQPAARQSAGGGAHRGHAAGRRRRSDDDDPRDRRLRARRAGARLQRDDRAALRGPAPAHAGRQARLGRPPRGRCGARDQQPADRRADLRVVAPRTRADRPRAARRSRGHRARDQALPRDRPRSARLRAPDPAAPPAHGPQRRGAAGGGGRHESAAAQTRRARASTWPTTCRRCRPIRTRCSRSW